MNFKIDLNTIAIMLAVMVVEGLFLGYIFNGVAGLYSWPTMPYPMAIGVLMGIRLILRDVADGAHTLRNIHGATILQIQMKSLQMTGGIESRLKQQETKDKTES